MCGISGMIHKKRFVSDYDIQQMNDLLVHRGPDGSGVYVNGPVGIGHRRLSIIDLEGGKQPLSNEDGKIWISFNGEIYNYRDLRKILVSKGHHFQTVSDTEVIVHAYEEWGTDCVTHLRGMFAFVIMDLRSQEIFLARDHFGIKPLFYGQSNEVFCFASEIQALRTVNAMEWSLDLSAIDQYLQFLYIPAPSTIYRSVRKLPPAHFMRVDFNGIIREIRRYWQFEFKESIARTKDEWIEGLTEVIKESVKAHLVSDVPFGAFLSGGIDSSAVVAFMSEQMSQPVKTFSIGFKEENYNELQYARFVAKRWQTEHYEEIVEPDALAILPALVKHYGEPFGDSSAIPTWYVSRLARRHVTMVLTGDAGDELFAGYESYTNRWNRHYSPVPEHLSGLKKVIYPLLSSLQPKRFPLRTTRFNDWLKYIQYYSDDMRSRLWQTELWNGISSSFNATFQTDLFNNDLTGHFQKVQASDFNTYLPNDILFKVDVASMMHSLETRIPLLDIRVAEFAATIPEELNIAKRNGKWEGKLLLKHSLEKYYPKEFLHRKKMGFAVPLEHWFGPSGNKQQEVEERLLDSGNGLDLLFDMKAVESICNSHFTGQKWQLLFLQEWLSQQKSVSI